MNYEFITMKDRVPFLVKELGDKITVGEDWNEDMSVVTVNIERGSDLIQIFHAGVNVGVKVMSQI